MTFAMRGRLSSDAQVAAHVDGRILQRDGEEEVNHEYSTAVTRGGLPPLECGGLPPLFSYQRRRQAAALRRLNLLFRGWCAKVSAAAHSFPELLPFLGGHLLPALHHPVAPMHPPS